MLEQFSCIDLSCIPLFVDFQPVRKGEYLDLVHTRERPLCRRMEQTTGLVDAALGIRKNLSQLIASTQLVECGGECGVFEDEVCDGYDGG